MSNQMAGQPRCIYFSRLARAHVPYFDEDERRFLLIERMCPDVIDICRNNIFFETPGASLRPTFMVRKEDGERKLITVKRRCDPCFAYHHNLWREPARAAGFKLRLVTSSLLKSGSALTNAEMIEQASAPHHSVRLGYIALYTERPGTVAELATLLPEGTDALSVALRLAFFGEIAFDPDRPIDREQRYRFTPNALSKTLDGTRAGSVH